MGMIEQLETPHDDVFAYAVTGRITEEDFTAIAEELEDALAQTETLHLVARMPEWPRFDLDVLDDDIGFYLKHRGRFGRAAVVTDSTPIRWVAQIEDALFGFDIRVFDSDEEAAAFAWAAGDSASLSRCGSSPHRGRAIRR
ncbi:UNVERIFIED_CONTAM: hypothetical protein BEN50_22135 [Euhalothece sp. KZN 001]